MREKEREMLQGATIGGQLTPHTYRRASPEPGHIHMPEVHQSQCTFCSRFFPLLTYLTYLVTCEHSLSPSARESYALGQCPLDRNRSSLSPERVTSTHSNLLFFLTSLFLTFLFVSVFFRTFFPPMFACPLSMSSLSSLLTVRP